jgi:adenylosuccinate lyase/1-aminocyclopropane-1-carboxylate deaminase/D-cysteine desulfhydrase-like pyridoxal-dependent ACC family enzyme
VSARITDSLGYAHLWGTAEVRAVFDEPARLQGWLDVVAALARAQAAEGLLPGDAAEAITAHARVGLLDLERVAERTRATGHSTLGLIQVLQEVLPEHARQHVYAHATVQDVTDTWTSLALRRVGELLRRDLVEARRLALELARTHRDTAMPGRTHGQPGAPVTFGFKAAGWADELGRHLDRLAEGERRWLVGQYAGGVGTLTGLGERGLRVRARLCAELGLAEPAISWLTARDRIAEVGHLLAMVTGTLARIGNEVYELSRPEIGELRETPAPGVVGSITMPHKVNPERSEHLDTLARLTRAASAVLTEGMVGAHERDGRSWKAEWVALPEACLLTVTATGLAVRLLDGLQVDAAAMGRALEREAGTVSAAALALLAPRLGPRAAQQALQDALQAGRERGIAPGRALVDAGLLTDPEAAGLAAAPDTGAAGPMVDAVLAAAADRPWAALPRMPLGVWPTPLVAAPRLQAALGLAGPLLVKRDDLAGFAAAGNKTRCLELLVADALARGARTLVTGGTPSSNFVAAAAGAAATAGLACHLVLAGERPASPPGNLAAAVRCGAVLHWTGDPDRSLLDDRIACTATDLDADDARCYPVPRGGATGLGAVGFALAAAELAAQLALLPAQDRALPVEVVLAAGSGGSLAGLVAGVAALRLPWRLTGVAVSRTPEQTRDQVARLAREALALAEPPALAERSAPAAGDGLEAVLERLAVPDGRGPGHGVPSPQGRAAAALALRTDGLLLDPVYGAKALAAVVGRPASERAEPVLTVLWHTGGLLDTVDELLADERVGEPE